MSVVFHRTMLGSNLVASLETWKRQRFRFQQEACGKAFLRAWIAAEGSSVFFVHQPANSFVFAAEGIGHQFGYE